MASQQSNFHPSYDAEICIGSDPVRTTLNLSDDLLTEAKALAEAFPDRSVVWVSATDGKPLGLAHTFGLRPITATGQANNNDFIFWGWRNGVQNNARSLQFSAAGVVTEHALDRAYSLIK